jgi:hypothetical protein
MKFPCRALCALFVATYAAHAASTEDDDATFGDYAPTVDDDLVIYVPKYTVKLGFRALTGAKSSFGGHGTISSAGNIGSDSQLNDPQNRDYHDGYVHLDTRTVVDPSGNNVPITPDGKTNTWSMISKDQLTPDGYVMMNTYSATITDPSFHEKNPGLAAGVELALERDMGKLLNSRVKWGLVAGFSVNQISSISKSTVAASITKITDYYSLFGQTIPPDADGNISYTGPTSSGTTDTTILLGNEIVHRNPPATKTSTTDVTSEWHLRGAYLTMRAGPTLYVPIGARFSATVSAGAVLVYSGTTFDVKQTFTPETGDDIVQSATGLESKLLPGFFVDANLQWSMTDNSGLYVGAVYQNSGDYEQTVTPDNGTSGYKARVDLSSLQGIRAGVNFRF